MGKPFSFTIPNLHFPMNYREHGYANGYVAIPKGHPLYEENYMDIDELYNIDIHGGLTLSEGWWDKCPEEAKDHWIIGFDTNHSFDSLDRWPDEESVKKEADRLLAQVEAIKVNRRTLNNKAPEMYDLLKELMSWGSQEENQPINIDILVLKAQLLLNAIDNGV